MNKLVVYGIGSLAEKIYYYNKRDQLFDLIGFIDDKKEHSIFCGLPVYSFDEFYKMFSPNDCLVFVAIGYVRCNYYREKVFYMVNEKGYTLTNYISPKSIIFEDTLMGRNILVCDNVFIGHKSRIEDGCILSVGTTLSHENIVGKFSFISSCVVFGGHAKVENNCFVGLHSTIKDSITIGAFSIVGSGSNVIKSTPNHSVTIGNPGVSTIKETENTII